MDRLSALPDEVISHILSFLPSPKILVQTSVLSKAWRFRWSRSSFGFATRQNTNPEVPLDSNQNIFHIKPGTTNHDFESWISARNIRNFVIALNYLPQCIFTSQSLIYLCIFNSCGGGGYKNGYTSSLCIPRGVYFPSLKKLELDNFGFHPYYSLTHLLKGCPVLENLMIQRMNRITTCNLKSATVTTLDLDIQNNGDKQINFVVLLGIPSLRYLRFRVRTYKIRNFAFTTALNSLIEADIDLMNVFEFLHWSPVTDLVCELYNVKRLTLATRRLMDVPDSHFYASGGNFYNLTQLNLRTDWRFITYFLKKSINLRALTIHMVDHGIQCWMEPRQVPECLVSNLETVNLVDFGWSIKHEFDMVKYILRNAKVLKRMEIKLSPYCRIDWNYLKKFEAIKRIATPKMGSRKCELILTLPSSWDFLCSMEIDRPSWAQRLRNLFKFVF